MKYATIALITLIASPAAALQWQLVDVEVPDGLLDLGVTDWWTDYQPGLGQIEWEQLDDDRPFLFQLVVQPGQDQMVANGGIEGWTGCRADVMCTTIIGLDVEFLEGNMREIGILGDRLHSWTYYDEDLRRMIEGITGAVVERWYEPGGYLVATYEPVPEPTTWFWICVLGYWIADSRERRQEADDDRN